MGDNARHSLFAQKHRIQQCADAFGVSVLDWYVDGGYSGRSMERPALQRLLAAARSGEHAFDVVLVYWWSSLSRSIADLHVLVSLLRDLGVEVVSVFEPLPRSAAAIYSRVSLAGQEYVE